MTLAVRNLVIQDKAGNLKAGATIEVRLDVQGQPIADIYEDRAGTILKANPFVTDDGKATIFALGGAYKITATLGDFVDIQRYVPIGRGAETDLALIDWKGTYSNATSYNSGMGVTHGSPIKRSFVSLVDGNLNNTPDATTPGDTPYWMLATGVTSDEVQAVLSDAEAAQAAAEAAAAAALALLTRAGAGRLTLTTGVPVTTSDVTAATALYFTPYKGDQIGIYSGSAWTNLVFAELSIKTTDAQTGTRGSTANGVVTGLTDTSQLVVGMKASGTGIGAAAVISSIDSATQVTLSVNNSATGSAAVTFKLPASTQYDVFCDYNGGAPKLRFVKWTDLTTRASAINILNGIDVSALSNSYRLLGTVTVTTTDGQLEDSKLNRYVSNNLNPEPRQMARYESASSWNWSTAAWQQANANAANQLNFTCCKEALVSAHVGGAVSSNTSTARTIYISIGLDSVADYATEAQRWTQVSANSQRTSMGCDYLGYPGIGKHSLTWLEQGAGADTQTWYGTGYHSGIFGVVMG